MSEPAQSYKNHAKVIPAFHFFVVPILLANVIWSARIAIQAPTTGSILASATALALITAAFFARFFALKAQDRVIRLEMRMLLRELWPAGLHPKISELTMSQLIALRFASDAELPELAQTVLRDGIISQKQIKLMIEEWKADHQRV